MTLMPDTFRDWLELFGLVFGAGVIVLIGWAVWVGVRLWLDRRRAVKQPLEGLSWESQLAVDTPAPAAPVKPGSPFAPKREAK